MGFFGNLFRRDQSAMPEPGSPEFERAVQGSALPGSVDMGQEGWQSAGAPVEVESGQIDAASLQAQGVPAESAQAAAEALQKLQQAFGAGALGSVSVGSGPEVQHVNVEYDGSQTIDASGMEGLRDEMLETLRAHGVDPDSGQAVDASQIPGLQEAMLAVLARHGIQGYGPPPS